MGTPEQNARYYLKNKAKYRERNTEQRKRNWDYVKSVKEKPCMDCGVTYPWFVMDFDHVRGDKIADISNMCSRGFSITSIAKEIEKCDLLCSNCHRIRTFSPSRRYMHR